MRFAYSVTRATLPGAKEDEARGHRIQNHHLHDRVIGRVAHVDVPILGALAHDGFVAEAQLQNVVLRMVQGPHDSDSHAKWGITVLITTESPRTAATHTRLSSRPSKPRAIQTWDASLYRTAPDSTSSPIKASSSPRAIILRRAWSGRAMGRRPHCQLSRRMKDSHAGAMPFGCCAYGLRYLGIRDGKMVDSTTPTRRPQASPRPLAKTPRPPTGSGSSPRLLPRAARRHAPPPAPSASSARRPS